MNRDSMRSLYQTYGEKRFAVEMINLINEADTKPESFSIGALWDAMGKPSLKNRDINLSRKVTVEDFDIEEAMDSTAFPKITGALINKVVQEAYMMETGIGDQLVTKIPSSVKEETIVGFSEDMGLQEVEESMAYEEGSLGEKYHKINNRKFGRIISLTEEMVKFDQTGQLIMRAKRIGEAAKAKYERIIMDGVLGLVTSGINASWRPAGSAATLYSSTSTDPYSSATLDNLGSDALADETDLQAALTLAAQFTDENGLPIMFSPKILLTATALKSIAYKICYSGQSVLASTPSGTANMFNGTQALSTSLIDQLVSATAWFYGDFKKQFVYTDVMPLQVLQAKAGNEKEFENDVVLRFKARLMGGCGAISNRYVIKGNV
jgi:hypothetical protein